MNRDLVPTKKKIHKADLQIRVTKEDVMDKIM